MIDPMLDVKGLAEKLSASVRTVWRLVAAKVIPGPVRVGGCARWFESDIEEYQKKLKESREKRKEP